jgi:hypothetical protein
LDQYIERACENTMTDYSKIYLIGVVSECSEIEDDVFTTRTVTVKTFHDIHEEDFTVASSDNKMKRKMGAIRIGDIVLITGDYLFGKVYPRTFLNVKNFKEMDTARVFLLNMEFSQDVFVSGISETDHIDITIPYDAPITGSLKTRDKINTNTTKHGSVVIFGHIQDKHLEPMIEV